METKAIPGRQPDAVVQFSVFTPNRLGRLHELVSVLATHNVHVLALAVLDTTDSAILRLVVDDPDKAGRLLEDHGFPFAKTQLVVVEINSADELNRLLTALFEAELNVHYLYTFIPHPNGKSVIALSMEDNEMAEQVLKRHQFTVLRQSDISR